MKSLLFKSIFMALAMAALLFYINSLTNRAVKAEATIAASIQLAKEKEAEDKIKAEQAAALDKISMGKRNKEQSAILNNFNHLLEKKGKENANLSNKLSDANASIEQLRLAIEGIAAGMPEGGDGQLPTESGWDCNTAYLKQSHDIQILEQGTALTTSQYNRCISLLESNCLRTGCTVK